MVSAFPNAPRCWTLGLPGTLRYHAGREDGKNKWYAGDERVNLPVSYSECDPGQQASREREVHRDWHVRDERSPLRAHVFNHYGKEDEVEKVVYEK